MDNLAKQFIGVVNGVKLVSLFGLIVLDTILGVLVAIVSKQFKWSKLASFLDTSVLTLVAGYFMVGIFATFEPAYSLAVPATWAIIDAKLIADIVSKLKDLGVAIRKPEVQ